MSPKTRSLAALSRPPGLADGTVLTTPNRALEPTSAARPRFSARPFGGKTRYYGGDVPGTSFESAQEVIGVFYALVWTSPFFDPNRGRWVRHVDEIIHRYTWGHA